VPLCSYLATSFSKNVAKDFARRAYHAAEGDHPAVMYTVLVDPDGGKNAAKRCMHVNLIKSSNLGNEREFLFAPYSVFTVVAMELSGTPNYLTPHLVTVTAANDNLIEPEDLPLAPWF